MSILSNSNDYYNLLRYLPYDKATEPFRQNASATVIIVREADLIAGSCGESYLLRSKPLFERRTRLGNQWGTSFPFREDQSAFSLGTGFFIHHNRILTAAHNIFTPRENLKWNDVLFIRNYLGPELNAEINIHQIYKPKSAESFPWEHQISRTGSDWALIEVEPLEPETPAPFIPVFSSDPIKKGHGVYGMGHGMGLGIKISNSGPEVIINDTRHPYFECNLPLLVSSSGSPVFCAQSHRLIGMLIRATDQIQKEGNAITLLAQNSHDEGQECQRLEPIFDIINTL